jgi:biopolymer transport protein ExbD
MIPLMDMLFLLLVFFVYTMLSMAVHRGLPVRLPASYASEAGKETHISITVQADGSVYIDREPVPLQDLTTLLTARTRDRDTPAVLLFADRDLRYQVLFDVLDRIRSAGLNRVSLQAELGPSP